MSIVGWYGDMKTKFISKKHTVVKTSSSVLAVLLTMVGSALANITTDLANFSQIITSFTTMFTSMMGVFMQPPLVYFVVLGLFITFVGLVASLLMRRKRRR